VHDQRFNSPLPLRVAVLGEALVDEFRDASVAGGAPFNVARALAAFGAPVSFISRIGADDPQAACLMASAHAFGLATAGMQRDGSHATGRVSVHEAEGSHRFEIHTDAAWDHLDLDAARAALQAHPPALIYFGSLAQRHPVSRHALRSLLKHSPALRLLDLNLRAGPDNQSLAAESMMLADWVKINDEELAQLLKWFAPGLTGEAGIAALMSRFALQRLVLTLGAAGWALFDPRGHQIAVGTGCPQPVLVDTVGAGDAFTAMTLAGLALHRDLGATLALANRYAAFICGVRGPLPAGAEALRPWREALQALPSAVPTTTTETP
jgi:fructokinase